MEIPAGDPQKDAAEPQEWLMGQEEFDLVESFHWGPSDETNACGWPRSHRSYGFRGWDGMDTPGEQSRAARGVNKSQLQRG